MRTILVLLALAAPIGLLAQRSEPMTVARVRAFTKEAEAEARGDKNEIVMALDKRVRARWGDFESFPVTIVRREDLSIVLSTPFMTYRRALAEYLRMEDPLAAIPWIPTAVVTISPIQLGAPDITEVAITRGVRAVPPSQNLLKPMSFTNGSGETAVIHAGEVRFPMSALAPGAVVTVTAVPKTGAAFVYTLDEGQLQTLK